MSTLSQIVQALKGNDEYNVGIGHDYKLYIVFKDEWTAEKYSSILENRFKLARVCFGQYLNAYGPLNEK